VFVLVLEWVVVHPRPGWRSGLASTHPAPRQRAGGCHDHVSGDRAAQSDDRARRWRRLMPRSERARGFGDPPVVTAAVAVWSCPWPACPPAGGRRGSAACGRSRWWRSSFRGVSQRSNRWRRTPESAWRSAPPGSWPIAATPSPAWRCARAGRSGPSLAPSGSARPSWPACGRCRTG
jgi:hypothetical protein